MLNLLNPSLVCHNSNNDRQKPSNSRDQHYGPSNLTSCPRVGALGTRDSTVASLLRGEKLFKKGKAQKRVVDRANPTRSHGTTSHSFSRSTLTTRKPVGAEGK